MTVEYMTFQDVLEALQIDEEELKRLVSTAELRGFRAGSSMKFKRQDVMDLKQGRETEPTIILTDSDQEMGIAESSDELILEDSTLDSVISRDVKKEELSLSFEPDDHDDGTRTGAFASVEVPSLADDVTLHLTDLDDDAALVEVGADEAMVSEAFELMDDEHAQIRLHLGDAYDHELSSLLETRVRVRARVTERGLQLVAIVPAEDSREPRGD